MKPLAPYTTTSRLLAEDMTPIGFGRFVTISAFVHDPDGLECTATSIGISIDGFSWILRELQRCLMISMPLGSFFTWHGGRDRFLVVKALLLHHASSPPWGLQGGIMPDRCSPVARRAVVWDRRSSRIVGILARETDKTHGPF